MGHDEIASSSSNLFPGQLSSKSNAAGIAGVNAYDGSKVDYSGADVTPEDFRAVLTGTATGKNLNSGPDDNVFVFFSGHGGAGLICFPSANLYKAGCGKIQKACAC